MREIKYTHRFKRDYKREKTTQHSKKLDAVLMETIDLLAAERSQSPTRSARVRGYLNAMT
jgi:mRNA-degrading endonuclease YafQ of YafQ-DinJ toxin-antitoxin module